MLIEKLALHVSDAASLLSVSSQKVYQMIHNGELKAYKTGKAWKIPVEALKAYTKSRLTK
ncbi:MAG: helix-turn-helix domain-containing protein [Veillonellales bacterium]